MSEPSPLRALPRRDLLLLPLIAIATMALLLVPAELVMRAKYPSELVDACLPKSTPGVFHGSPGCVSMTKAAEGPWVINRYNECGYRDPETCGPAPAGTLRVAVIGSSIGAGFLTPFEDTFAVRAGAALTARCRSPVEFQNLAAAGNTGERLAPSAAEALALDPDALLLLVSPFDFDPGKAHDAAPDVKPRTDFLRRARDIAASSRLLYMESYFLLRDDSSYLPVYLHLGHGADFMRLPLPAAWRRQLEIFDAQMAKIAEMTASKNVPMLLVFLPQRAQAALASSNRREPEFHPRSFQGELAEIAARHGIIFDDVTAAIPHNMPTSTIYYANNGHINSAGHELVGKTVVERLASPEAGRFAQRCAGEGSPGEAGGVTGKAR